MSKPKVGYRISNHEALDSLNVKEKQVIQMRLGIGEYTRQYTLKEISEILGHPWSERARQIEACALRKLRHPLRKCKVLIKGYDYDENI